MLVLKRGLAPAPSALPISKARWEAEARKKPQQPRTVNHMFSRQWKTESAVAEDDIEEMVSYESTLSHLFQLYSCDIIWTWLGIKFVCNKRQKKKNNYLAAILKTEQKCLSKIAKLFTC